MLFLSLMLRGCTDRRAWVGFQCIVVDFFMLFLNAVLWFSDQCLCIQLQFNHQDNSKLETTTQSVQASPY